MGEGELKQTSCTSPIIEKQLSETKLTMKIISVCFSRDGVGYRCIPELIRKFCVMFKQEIEPGT